jgi:cell wall assembly regulator SMI1
MLIKRKNHSSLPSPVAESWRRIEAWLERHLPRTRATLRPGVADKDLRKFERAIGRRLPDDVRASWQIHDGQGWPRDGGGRATAADPGRDDEESWYSPDPEVTGVIYGQALLALVEEKDALSDRSALRAWQELAEAADRGASEEDPRAESSPPGAVRLCYNCRGWVPLHWDGNRNYLGIDLDPGPGGVEGQVINFGGDEPHKYVLATSWAQFLGDLADELEAGNFLADKKHRFGSFLLKKPRTAPLYTQYRAWAKAKLPRDFQRGAPARPPEAAPPVVTGELADVCVGVVRGFLAAMNEWERHWLSVRPLAPFGVVSLTEVKGGRIEYMALRRYEPDEPIPDAARALRDESLPERDKAKLLQVGKHYRAAIRQKRAIFKNFCTPGERVGLEDFEQGEEPAYDPAALRVAEVRQAAADHNIVVLEPEDGVTRRYHVRRVGRRWLLESKDRTRDGERYEKVSL